MKLTELRVGDRVTRLLSGVSPHPLTVTEIEGDKIVCGAWEFHRKTGCEIDEDLGWDGLTKTGSFLVVDELGSQILERFGPEQMERWAAYRPEAGEGASGG